MNFKLYSMIRTWHYLLLELVSTMAWNCAWMCGFTFSPKPTPVATQSHHLIRPLCGSTPTAAAESGGVREEGRTNPSDRPLNLAEITEQPRSTWWYV